MQPLFESCSDLLESHRYAECIHRLGELVRTAQTAEELILAARVADAALLRGLELRLVRRAARLAPADPDVILYQAGTYLERGRFLEAEELLLPYLEDADWAEDERSRAHGYLAISYAARRRFRSAARALEQATALAAAAGTDAEHLVEYIRLNIQAYQDQWEDSIKGLHALIEAGGDELRALMLMATCHECLGDADAVVRTLRQACERFPEYPALHLRLSSAAWAVGRTDLAHQALEKVAALLPGRSGDRIVRRCRDMLDEPGRRLHVPPVRQGHNNCFPACLDMLLAYYGRPADQRSIGAVVRDGNGGTPLFRALRYLEEQGWAVRTFRATPERVRQLIDRGVPPILGLEWAGGAHVHICAGYDDQWLYIQDPGSFQRRHLRLKGFDDVYAHSDYWALAVVPPESAGLLDILPAEDDAAIRRVQACWEHLSQDRRGEAAALLAEIDREERTVSSALLRLRVWPRLGTQEGALEAADWLLARFPDHRQIRLEVAQHLVRLDQEDRAVALVREHKGRQPSRALIILGDAARRESPEEACRLYRKAAIADPESELPLAHWGDAELQLGNLERAEALFEAAYEMDPSPGRAADLAHLLLRQGRPAEAVAAFRKVLREEPFFAWAWYMRAEAHWALGQHRVAARCFRIAMAQDRERAHPVDRLADLYSETGQPARAIALLRESPLLPTSADLQLSLAILLGGQGEWAEALAIAEPAMHRFPEDVRFGPFVAECLRLTGRQPEGRALLERLADEHPDEAYVQARFGRFLLLEGEAEKGVEHIDRALRLKPEWEDPLDWALGAARKAEQPEPALRYLTDKLVPAGHPARLAYLARLWADHDLAQARELALAAWEHEDIPAGALGDVADVLLRCDDARGALAALRQALRKDRVYAWAWWCRGHAHWALGQRRAAIRAMRIAVAQDPDAPAPLRQLAEWYEETGRPDRAVAVLRESPLTAGSADLQHDLALLLLRLGRHAEALDVARGALDQFGEAGRFGPVAADALAGLENRAEALALLTRLGEQAEAGGDFDCLRDLARAWAKYDRARAVHWGRKAVALVEPERRQLSCGLMLAEFGEHGEAETVLRRVVEELPSPKAFYALSQIAQEKGDHAARVDWLRRAVETAEGPDDALDYAGELGEALLEAGEPDAVTELMTGLAGRVNEAWRLTYLGWVAERAERYADAVAHYEAALQADPAYGWTHYRLPQALAALDRHEEALEAAVAGVSRFPADAAFQWLAGKCLAAVGRRDEAATHFRRALRLDPGSAAAAHGLWSAWAEEGAAALEAQLGGLPEATRAGVLCRAGDWWRQDGNQNEAVAAWEAAARIDPRSAGACVRLAEAALERKDEEEAWRHASEALLRDPDQVQFARRMWESTDPDRAAAALAAVVEQVGDDHRTGRAHLRYLLGEAYLLARREKPALEAWQAAVEDLPAQRGAVARLVQHHHARGEHRRVVELVAPLDERGELPADMPGLLLRYLSSSLMCGRPRRPHWRTLILERVRALLDERGRPGAPLGTRLELRNELVHLGRLYCRLEVEFGNHREALYGITVEERLIRAIRLAGSRLIARLWPPAFDIRPGESTAPAADGPVAGAVVSGRSPLRWVASNPVTTVLLGTLAYICGTVLWPTLPPYPAVLMFIWLAVVLTILFVQSLLP